MENFDDEATVVIKKTNMMRRRVIIYWSGRLVIFFLFSSCNATAVDTSHIHVLPYSSASNAAQGLHNSGQNRNNSGKGCLFSEVANCTVVVVASATLYSSIIKYISC
jgi:hypothetical protein